MKAWLRNAVVIVSFIGFWWFLVAAFSHAEDFSGQGGFWNIVAAIVCGGVLWRVARGRF